MARRLSVEARRREIVETVQALIVRRGYRDLSLREVARECGMSAPGLIHHFPTMEDLLEAVLEHRDETDMAAIGVSDAGGRSVEELVDAAVAYYAQRSDDQQMFDALEVEALDPRHPAHDWYVRRNDRVLEALRPAIEREFADPDLAMRLLRYLIDGMRLSISRSSDPAEFATGATAVKSLLVHGLERKQVPADS
ncbi:TetR/AcrR family transcriptional regulator [Leifsonia sp. 22587]|uniref:TetR/AcrR family transcriptional regulator n=1 Tax=Leifsonia sp. 22587 TaxID=3453946 RepID=UPI003F83ECA0